MKFEIIYLSFAIIIFMDRTIVHMDLDTFFVSCARLTNPELNGIPLIIGGGTNRGVVSSCSYEARKYGVRSAMPMGMAIKLCPDAKVVKGDMELFSKYSHMVTDVIEDKAPVMEKASIDEFYLDVSGMDKFFGCFKWTTELALKVTKETGLPISFALSTNKTVAKIGTGESKPVGRMEIKENMIRSFLDPLSIKKIPMLGTETFQLLSRIGIRHIKTLSEMPVEVLAKLLGKNGQMLWKKANGIDDSLVEPYKDRKSLSSERTFEQDTMDIVKVKALLTNMVEKLAFQLRDEEWLTSQVAVRIRYNNFDTEIKQCKIQYTSCDHILLNKVMELFDKHYNRRMRLRLVGIKFGGLVKGNYQIDMFNDTLEQVALYQAMDKMKHRYGANAIFRSTGLGLINPK